MVMLLNHILHMVCMYVYGYCKVLQCKLPNVRFGEISFSKLVIFSIFVIHEFCVTSRYTAEG